MTFSRGVSGGRRETARSYDDLLTSSWKCCGGRDGDGMGDGTPIVIVSAGVATASCAGCCAGDSG